MVDFSQTPFDAFTRGMATYDNHKAVNAQNKFTESTIKEREFERQAKTQNDFLKRVSQTAQEIDKIMQMTVDPKQREALTAMAQEARKQFSVEAGVLGLQRDVDRAFSLVGRTPNVVKQAKMQDQLAQSPQRTAQASANQDTRSASDNSRPLTVNDLPQDVGAANIPQIDVNELNDRTNEILSADNVEVRKLKKGLFGAIQMINTIRRSKDIIEKNPDSVGIKGFLAENVNSYLEQGAQSGAPILKDVSSVLDEAMDKAGMDATNQGAARGQAAVAVSSLKGLFAGLEETRFTDFDQKITQIETKLKDKKTSATGAISALNGIEQEALELSKQQVARMAATNGLNLTQPRDRAILMTSLAKAGMPDELILEVMKDLK